MSVIKVALIINIIVVVKVETAAAVTACVIGKGAIVVGIHITPYWTTRIIPVFIHITSISTTITPSNVIITYRRYRWYDSGFVLMTGFVCKRYRWCDSGFILMTGFI